MQFNGGVYNSDIWRQKFRDGPYCATAQQQHYIIFYLVHNHIKATPTPDRERHDFCAWFGAILGEILRT